jgi:hypothetical protein
MFRLTPFYLKFVYTVQARVTYILYLTLQIFWKWQNYFYTNFYERLCMLQHLKLGKYFGEACQMEVLT